MNQPQFSTGQILNNRYRLVNLLGEGGFGAVYRAWDMSLQTPCAVKRNFDTTPEAQKQFEQEARILANLHHPNLPRVTDYFTIPGFGQFLVMDFVEGEDLHSKLTGQVPMPEREVLAWADQICEALTYLHTQQPSIIHRDIKPANIRVTPQGRAMLVDFGIAKAFDPSRSTTAGAKAVTPGYSPIEQYGHSKTDARSDVYALGATLYHLLTGVQPPESIERLQADTLMPPTPLSPSVGAAILTAMALHPDRRFQTAAAFQAALQGHEFPLFTVNQRAGVAPAVGTATRLVPAPTFGTPPSSGGLPQPAQRKFLVAGGIGLLLLLALFCGVLLGGLLPALSSEPPPPSPVPSESVPPATSPSLPDEPTAIPAARSPIPTEFPPTASALPTETSSPALDPPITPTPTRTPVPQPTTDPNAFFCPGALPTRLKVGDQIRVTFTTGDPSRLRKDPMVDPKNTLVQLAEGTKMTILDGPICAARPNTNGLAFVFWHVRVTDTGQTGWVAEGDLENYYLEELP